MRSIITRVLVAVLTVITAFSAALAYSASEQRRLVAQMTRVNQGYVPIARQLDALEEEVRTFGRVLTNPDPSALRQSIRASMALAPANDRIELALTDLRAHLDATLSDAADDDERAFLSNVRRVADDLSEENTALTAALGRLLQKLEATPPQVEPLYSEIGARVIAFERRVGDLAEVVDRRTDAAIDEVRRAEGEILVRVVAVSLAATLFALIVVLIIGRSLAPIRALTALASRFKHGDYTHEPIDAGNDEIGTLAAEFSSMATAIEERDGILRRQKAQLEEAYAALLDAQRAQVQSERLAAVGEISARVTHELRNPLSSIGLNVEMLDDELRTSLPQDSGGEARQMLGAIEREVARLTELTERYLSMARSDAPRRDSCDLVALSADVVDQQRATAERAGVQLEVEGDAVQASVDAPQIRQVLINLIRNAIQAMEGRADGAVRVLVTGGEDQVQIAVEDNGPGVSDDLAETLFEPFVTGKRDGTGLGLSISRTIARSHGGDLCVTQAPSGGARFELTLPA